MARGRTTDRRAFARARRSETPDALVVTGANAVRELLGSAHPVQQVHLGPGTYRAELEERARARGIAVELTDRATLDRVARSPHHQGAVAVAAPFAYAPLADVVGGASVLVLDGIQDPRNLGAVLRTARAAGVPGVVLPADRSAPVSSIVVTAAAGLLFGLRIARVPNLVRAMQCLKEAGFWLIGLVPRGGTPLFGFEPPARPALVVGGEGEGLRPLVRRTCDFAVTIPMAPGVESLNVAVAAGLALYEVVARRRAI